MADFKKRIYSGVCMCGHHYEHHHLGVVLTRRRTPSWVFTSRQECEFFGSNEDGGLDENGEDHCFGYVDGKDRDPEARAGRKGTAR